MALIHRDSCECVKSELDLFTLPLTQSSIESGQWVQYHPIAPLGEGMTIEYVIPPSSGDDYFDLSHTLLALKVKVVKKKVTGGRGAAAEVAEDETPYAPVNNFAHSLFSQIDVTLNQKTITSPSHTYPYRAYIETLLGYDMSAKKSHLTSRVWHKDTARKMHHLDHENEGFQKRSDMFKNGVLVDMITNLHIDLFNQEKFLLSGVEMRLKLIRSKPQFHLMAQDDCDLETLIHSATLMVRKVKINPSVLIAHSRALEKASAKYPITRVDVKVLSLSGGIRSKVFDSVYLGQLPKRVILGFVKNATFNGKYSKNPFNFGHFEMTFLSLYVDGVQVPSYPLDLDFVQAKSPNFVEAYHTLFSGTGIHFKDEGNDISREEYPFGYCLFAFDLTPDLSSHTVHWNLQRSGCLRIEVRFQRDLPEPVNLVVYSEFDSLIEIDKYRNVQTDYSS